MPVRVRFAPSPTGALHVGGARTALFNDLYRRHEFGTLVLRIEDTDAERSIPEAEARLENDLDWLGITFDESPRIGGPYGPYRQSERGHFYRQASDALLTKHAAYRCWCSAERLAAGRELAASQHRAPRYDRRCRHLTDHAQVVLLDSGTPFVVRLMTPLSGEIALTDLVKGRITFPSIDLDDPILVRSDGSATSLLAGPVDDAGMRITHIIRGEEWLASTPYQRLIFEALGMPLPHWGHLSLLLDEDRRKLSKRHGGATIGELRRSGLLPQALSRYLASLGRANFNSEEGWTTDSLVASFDLSHYRSGEVVYSVSALSRLNGVHIRQMSVMELIHLVGNIPEVVEDWHDLDEAARSNFMSLAREDAETVTQVARSLNAYLAPDFPSREDWNQHPRSGEVISGLIESVSEVEGPIESPAWRALVDETGSRLGVKGRGLYAPVRLALTGRDHGPAIGDIMKALGPSVVLKRLERTQLFLKSVEK